MTQKFTFAAFLALTLVSCGGPPAPPAPEVPAVTPADLILKNGYVYTVDDERSVASAVAVRDGRIVYVGDDEGADSFAGAGTQIVDLVGKMVLPGFQDTHAHPSSAGYDELGCPFFDAETEADVLAAVRTCAQADPDAPFIRGAGWRVSNFEDGLPNAAVLDAIDDGRPILLEDADGHTSWTNTAAIIEAGISAETPDPPGGYIGRDAETGEPNGIFQETAMDLVRGVLPPPSDDDLVKALEWAQSDLNRLGITAVNDAIVKLDSADAYRSLPAWRRLADQDRLNLRVVASLHWTPGADIGAQIRAFKDARTKNSGGRFNATAVKIWADGVVEVYTAMMLEPYSDRPDTSGLMMVPRDELLQAAPLLDAEGFQLHIHTIGDATARYALDAIEASIAANGRRDARHFLAHVQFVDPSDTPRFASLGVAASFQPLWAFEETYITDFTRPRVGPDRIQWCYPIKSVLDAGGRVAFGSDWAVDSADPLLGIEVAVTRLDPATGEGPVFLPEQRISLAEAIAAYTREAAWVNFLDDDTGTIETGKYADLVVIDRNLFDIPPADISEATVVLTLLEGEAVYGDPAGL